MRTEFHEAYGLQRNRFTERVFGILDANGSGELDLQARCTSGCRAPPHAADAPTAAVPQEFVLGLWNFCTYDDEHLLHFSMTLYDVDARGYMTPPECSSLVRMYYGSEIMNSRVAEVPGALGGSGRDGRGGNRASLSLRRSWMTRSYETRTGASLCVSCAATAL